MNNITRLANYVRQNLDPHGGAAKKPLAGQGRDFGSMGWITPKQNRRAKHKANKELPDRKARPRHTKAAPAR